MIKAFSNSAKIFKMTRRIVVFLEEQTLTADLYRLNSIFGDASPCYGEFVKYVSTKSKGPRDVFIYWDKVLEGRFLVKVTKLIVDNSKSYLSLKKAFVKSYADFEKICDKYWNFGEEFWNKQSKSNLKQFFLELSDINRIALSAYYIPYYLVLALSKLVQDELEQKTGVQSKEIFQIICSLGIDTVIAAERSAFLKRLGMIQGLLEQKKTFDSKEVSEIIFKQWYEFGGCTFTDQEIKAFTISDYREKLSQSLNINAFLEEQSIKKTEKENQIRLKAIFDKLSGCKDLILHVKFLREMLSYRNREAEYYDAYFERLIPFFLAIAKRIGIPLDDFWLLSTSEITDSLDGKVNPRTVVFDRKKQGFVIKKKGSKIVVEMGVTKADWHEAEREEKVRVLKGSVASKGIVEGTVHIVFNPVQHASRFREGEILVTSMTTPDFVPMMKKAMAIVTDEGGILCHAAIVSRELDVPCVVGTKVSTQVLNDGDYVRVDAIKGKVEILKRNL